ncbi:MAG: hypothetical protein ACUVTG_12490 [Candidatus Oleimicrobiaceae bacterium]
MRLPFHHYTAARPGVTYCYICQVSRSVAGEDIKQPIGWTTIPEFEDRVDTERGRHSYWVQACTDVHCSDYSMPAVTSADFSPPCPWLWRNGGVIK